MIMSVLLESAGEGCAADVSSRRFQLRFGSDNTFASDWALAPHRIVIDYY